MSTGFRAGFHPFWFWNAQLDADEIRRQIREMADKGIRGFFIHNRQGLATPYMSDMYFDAVGAAVEQAEQSGLSVHLYDEYPYPSGVAGGEVVLGSPEFHATMLTHRWTEVEGGPTRLPLPIGKVLACTAYPMAGSHVDWAEQTDLRSAVGMVLVDESYVETGLTQYNRKRYFASNPTPVLECRLPEGSWMILAAVQQRVTHHKYWGAFADVLNAEAVRRFISCTHERYYERFSDKFGSVIQSIFVDETAPKWSRLLLPEYEKRHGRSLVDDLPALLGESHPQHTRVRSDFEHVRHDLFVRAFEIPVSRWCTEHGILYTGEKPSYRLSQLNHMGAPGCEPGHIKAGAPLDLNKPSTRQNARATASAQYLYDKPWSLCECYHSIGWSGTMQDARLIADGLLMMGITCLVPHGFFYSTHALKKHDAPPSFYFQMPYWKHWKTLSDRVDRITKLCEGTWIAATVLVVDPEPHVVDNNGREVYGKVLDTLLDSRLDYMVVDVDVLREARVDNGAAVVKDLSAPVVVVPPMRAPEPELVEALERLVESGVTIFQAVEPFDRRIFTQAVSERTQPGIDVHVVTGEDAGMHMITRTNGTDNLHLLLNTQDRVIGIQIHDDRAIEELPIEKDIPPLLAKGDAAFERVLQPFELVILRSHANASGAAGATGRRDDGSRVEAPVTVQLGGPCTVTPMGLNLLRMYHWRMELMGDDGQPLQEATVRAIPIANQLRDGGFRFAPDIRMHFGHTPELGFPEMTVRYTAEFICDWDGPVELTMEPGSIKGSWSISVNGQAPVTAENFRSTTAHIHGSLGVDITESVKPGPNRVVVDVKTDRSDGGLRNPLYLSGNFGVDANRNRLYKRLNDGRFEQYAANGLPYYAGCVEYGFAKAEFSGQPGDLDPVVLLLVFDDPFEEAVEISINDGPWRLVPWSPYRITCPAAELKRRGNRVRARVYTSLIRAFEGQEFDRIGHRYRDIG